MFIDTHAHLTDKRYEDPESIIKNLNADGVDFIVNCSYDEETIRGSHELAARYDTVFASAGIHPSDASRLPDSALRTVEEYIDKPRCVAMGEIGLDYHYDGYNKERQHFFFVRQLEIAHAHKKPVIIHSREATGDMMKILRDNRGLLQNGGVMHSFADSVETMREYVKMGFFISFSGTLTYNQKYQEVLPSVPLDRLVFETDCPYLTPVPHRGKLNYPAYVKFVYEFAADKLGMRVETLCKIVRENTKNLFGIKL